MSKFKKILFPLILILLTGFICFLNYTPDTFLTGWDTLHPEFNFSLNLKRLFNIWHFEKGLGTIPAHAQISELPRLFILWIFHFFFPLNFLRYAYIFLCFIIGPFGIYFLIKKLFSKSIYKSLIAFTTSLLYIFNLSTLQQFYLPFEMFPTQWAFLPWIILFSIKFLTDKEKNKKNLIIFALLTIFASPQAYASQLWYAFFIIYFLFLIIYSVLNKQKIKKSLTLIVCTLLLNAFWLVPNLFYIFTSSQSPQQNHDNRLYSQEYLLRNRQNGVLSDSTLIKGFYLDWSSFDFSKNTFKELMPEWQQHLQNPYIPIIGYTIFALALFGLIISFFKKDKLFISLSPFFIIPFILLSNRTPPFSFLFDLLIKHPTIRESFRFIFTKLSILLLSGLIIFFSYALNFIFQKIKQNKNKIILSLLIITSLVVYTSPIFKGKLISSIVRVNIPQQYFHFWDYMKEQEDGRVLTLPINQSSGWQYYSWGYQGSGFLWFNLKQSLLDRDFDRWNTYNEESYREFFNSLYSQDHQQFTNSLQKYSIKYIVWDQNIINSSSKNNKQITFQSEIRDLLQQLEEKNIIKKINQFDQLIIYQNNQTYPLKRTKKINNFINPSYKYNYFDFAPIDYITSQERKSSTYYPFRDILTDNQQLDLSKIDLKQQDNNHWQITLKNKDSLSLEIPPLLKTEEIIPAQSYIEKNQQGYEISFEFPLPQELLTDTKNSFTLSTDSSSLKINDLNFEIKTDLDQKEYLGQVNIFTNRPNYINNKNINFNFNNQKDLSLKTIQINSQSLNFTPSKTFENLNDTQNYSINLNNLPNSFGYILAFKSQYYSGIPLRICLKNEYSFLCSLEDQLNKNKENSWDYFLVPSTGENIGYDLNVENISFGNQLSKSLLKEIAIIPIPYQFLSQIKNQNKPSTSIAYYTLDQSFHPGWKAFYFQGLKPVFIKNHQLYNNWGNAWPILTEPEHIFKTHVIFWPQLLQIFSLFLSTTTFIWIIVKKKRKKIEIN